MDFDFSLSTPKIESFIEAEALISSLWHYCRHLTQENCDLKEKLNLSIQNFSILSSSAPLYKRKRSFKEAQISNEQVDEFIACYPPEQCELCKAQIKRLSQYSRKQVCDLPNGKLHTTEYQLYHGRCSGCKKRYHVRLPENVSPYLLGYQALAKIALLAGKFRLSKRLTNQLLWDFYELKVCIGTISNREAQVTQALAKPTQMIEEAISISMALNVDETSHFYQHHVEWLWVKAPKQATVFNIFPKREKKSAMGLIGETYKVIFISGHFVAYFLFNVEQHQYCWAHLIRDFRKISERENPKEAYIGHVLLDEARWLIYHWHRAHNKQGEKLKNHHVSWLKGYPNRLKSTSEGESKLRRSKTSKLCHRLLNHWQCLWHFLSQRGIRPTNNKAERALRQAVIRRKLNYRTQSERGKLFVERILSVVETCRQQNLSVIAFLEKAIVQSREINQYQ